MSKETELYNKVKELERELADAKAQLEIERHKHQVSHEELERFVETRKQAGWTFTPMWSQAEFRDVLSFGNDSENVPKGQYNGGNTRLEVAVNRPVGAYTGMLRVSSYGSSYSYRWLLQEMKCNVLSLVDRASGAIDGNPRQ